LPVFEIRHVLLLPGGRSVVLSLLMHAAPEARVW
jgi:hypothetical protein